MLMRDLPSASPGPSAAVPVGWRRARPIPELVRAGSTVSVQQAITFNLPHRHLPPLHSLLVTDRDVGRLLEHSLAVCQQRPLI